MAGNGGNRDYNNTGRLFKNDRKQSDKHPDYKGDAKIDGVEMWVSAWVKEVQNGDNAGKKFFSMSFQPKDEQRGSSGGGQRRSDPPPKQQQQDEIPF